VFYLEGTRVLGRLPAGGVKYRHVRRQLELEGTYPDAGQRADHSGLVQLGASHQTGWTGIIARALDLFAR
jgi:hypothetical protein